LTASGRPVRGWPPLCLLALLAAAGCAAPSKSNAPPATGMGLHPVLPAPQHSLLPTVRVASARGWSPNATPIAAPDLRVDAFARGLDHPRWLYVLPNGDVLVAETNAPARADDGGGIRNWFMGLAMKRAGAATRSANRITLLRDRDGNGVAELRSVLLDGLDSPFGMALVDDTLYVANTSAIVAFPYADGDTRIRSPGTVLLALPAGPINHHWTKNLIASADGQRLYVTVGSNSNVGERGMAVETDRAAIWEVGRDNGTHRVFASGLRNPNGMAWNPHDGTLWTVVNERDELGHDLVPDYLTSVQDGGFYGWPYSYFGQHVDTRARPERPDLVQRAVSPDYALGAHVAPLGLVHSGDNQLPSRFAEGMFIGEHGSWNRWPRSGYQVVFVPFDRGRPRDGVPEAVLTGFLNEDGEANGRPVGVALDRRGALLVADDVGNAVWRVSSR
jgi:glucose/arabinose dehydrogenase